MRLETHEDDREAVVPSWLKPNIRDYRDVDMVLSILLMSAVVFPGPHSIPWSSEDLSQVLVQDLNKLY